MKNRISKKIKSKAGVSISELLVATIILLLVTSGMVTAIGQASRHFVRSRSQSEAKILCSTLETLGENELRFASNIQEITDAESHDKTYQYMSKTHAKEYSYTTFSVSGDDKETFIIDGEEVECGTVVLYYPTETSVSDREVNLLPPAMYPMNLKARMDIVDYSDHKFEVKLVIVDASGDVLIDDTYYVENLNKKDIEHS